tara:strand:- start:5472 stop:6293 length:822 start_codon:yes stop_codon:yes gene_type:complete
MNIGIVGTGFVGSAILRFLKENTNHNIQAYDIRTGKDPQEGYKEIAYGCDFIYLCLPTPQGKNGECDTGIVRGALTLLNHYAEMARKKLLVMIKSTMSPGTSDRFRSENYNIVLVTNPEFLSEKTAYQDVSNTKKHVIGINKKDSAVYRPHLEKYHKDAWPDSECIFVSPIEAELIKYLTNSYFAVKVTFANHIYQLSQKLDIDYNNFISSAIKSDSRIGDLHWQVPGHDGKLGFGGHCLPKDLLGMVDLMNSKGVDSSLLQTAKEYNSRNRK